MTFKPLVSALIVFSLLLSNQTIAQRIYASKSFGCSIKIPVSYEVKFYNDASSSDFMLSAYDSLSYRGNSPSPRNVITVERLLDSRYPRVGTIDKLFNSPQYVLAQFTRGGGGTVYPVNFQKKMTLLNGRQAIEVSYFEGKICEESPCYAKKITMYITMRNGYIYAARYLESHKFEGAKNGGSEIIDPKHPVKPEEGVAAIKTFKLL